MIEFATTLRLVYKGRGLMRKRRQNDEIAKKTHFQPFFIQPCVSIQGFDEKLMQITQTFTFQSNF